MKRTDGYGLTSQLTTSGQLPLPNAWCLDRRTRDCRSLGAPFGYVGAHGPSRGWVLFPRTHSSCCPRLASLAMDSSMDLTARPHSPPHTYTHAQGSGPPLYLNGPHLAGTRLKLLVGLLCFLGWAVLHDVLIGGKLVPHW